MVEDVVIKMGLDARPITAALRSVRKDFADFRSELSKSFNKVGGIGGIIAAGTAILTLGVKKVMDYADQLQNLSDQADVTTDTIQKLNDVAIGSGASAEAVASGISKIVENIGEAVQENPKALAAFAKLKIGLNDLMSRDNDEVLQLVGERLSGISDSAARMAIQVDLAGKAGKKLGPALMGLGQDSIGPILSGESARAIDQFGDSLTLLGNKAKAFGGNLIGPFLRAFSLGHDAQEIEIGIQKAARARGEYKRVVEKTAEQIERERKAAKEVTDEKKKQLDIADKLFIADGNRASAIAERRRQDKLEMAKDRKELAESKKELADLKADRNRLTLEQLAGASKGRMVQRQIGKWEYADKDRAEQIRIAKEAMKLDAKAKTLFPGMERDKIQSRSDKLKAMLGALKDDERNPFKSFEKSIADQTDKLEQILNSGKARFQAMTGD